MESCLIASNQPQLPAGSVGSHRKSESLHPINDLVWIEDPSWMILFNKKDDGAVNDQENR
jgi:hypothetical protein